MNRFIRLNSVKFLYDMHSTLTNPLTVSLGEYLIIDNRWMKLTWRTNEQNPARGRQSQAFKLFLIPEQVSLNK